MRDNARADVSAESSAQKIRAKYSSWTSICPPTSETHSFGLQQGSNFPKILSIWPAYHFETSMFIIVSRESNRPLLMRTDNARMDPIVVWQTIEAAQDFLRESGSDSDHQIFSIEEIGFPKISELCRVPQQEIRYVFFSK